MKLIETIDEFQQETYVSTGLIVDFVNDYLTNEHFFTTQNGFLLDEVAQSCKSMLTVTKTLTFGNVSRFSGDVSKTEGMAEIAAIVDSATAEALAIIQDTPDNFRGNHFFKCISCNVLDHEYGYSLTFTHDCERRTNKME